MPILEFQVCNSREEKTKAKNRATVAWSVVDPVKESENIRFTLNRKEILLGTDGKRYPFYLFKTTSTMPSKYNIALGQNKEIKLGFMNRSAMIVELFQAQKKDSVSNHRIYNNQVLTTQEHSWDNSQSSNRLISLPYFKVVCVSQFEVPRDDIICMRP